MDHLQRGLSAHLGLMIGIMILVLVIPQQERWILYVVYGGGLLVLWRTIGQEP